MLHAAKCSAFLFYVPFVSCYTWAFKAFRAEATNLQTLGNQQPHIPLLCAAQVILKASVETHCGFSNACWFLTFLLSWDVSLDWNMEIKWNGEMENRMEQLMYAVIARVTDAVVQVCAG